MTQEKTQIVCSDGVALAAILLLPSHSPKAVVQINSATATPKEYYLPFAQYLAENGFVACVFDYRGVCESATQPMKSYDFPYTDWGKKDMASVLDYLDGRFPSLSKLIMGHSVGGQKIGFADNHHKIKGMVTFATSAGYWGYMPLKYRLTTRFFFHVFTPISKLLFGYVAAKRLGLMEDLPYRVVKEWRDYCSVPEYFFDPQFYGKTTPIGHYQAFDFPIQLYWATDDTIVNARSVASFWKHVKSSKGINIETLTPRDYGVSEIGHFGFFRRKFRDILWPKALAKLEGFLG
ncbi:MAG: alpha/beta hydrolase [Spirosomaceae bacterium]|jgi:predicted alpha/beta hydrolase|nr:alpha/beta hydrolase [Spirosomataceae bacterium]